MFSELGRFVRRLISKTIWRGSNMFMDFSDRTEFQGPLGVGQLSQ